MAVSINNTNTAEDNIRRFQRPGAYDGLPNSTLIAAPSESDLRSIAPSSSSLRTEVELSSIGKIEVSQATYDFIQNRLSGIFDNAQREAEEIRLASAITYSRNLNIPFSTAYSNLDTLAKNWNGFAEYKPTVSNYRAILNSFSISKRSFDRGRIGDELKRTTDPARRQMLLDEAAALEADIESLQDYVPRNFLIEMAKASANSSYFTVRSVLSGLKYGKGAELAIKAVSAVAPINPALSSLIAASASLYGGFKVSQSVEGGNLYLDLLANGVEDNIAQGVSDIGGALIGAIEVGLDGLSTSWLKALGVPIENFTSKLITRLISKGTLGKFGMFLTKTAASAGMEGLEEGLQGIVSLLGEDIAYALSETTEQEPDWNIVRNFASDFAGGFASSILLGLPANAISTSLDTATVRDLKSVAVSVRSKEEYDKIAAKLKPEDITEADWKTVTDHEFERAGERAVSEFNAQISQEDIDTTLVDADAGDEAPISRDDPDSDAVGEREPAAEPYRTSSGRLWGHEVRERTYIPRAFGQSHRYAYGEPGGQAYGTLTYRTDREGNLTISSVKTRQGYEGVREEMVRDFTQRFPDMNITWDTLSQTDTEIRDRIISSNPRGSQYGLNYGENTERTADREIVKSRLDNIFSDDDTMNSAMAEIVELIGEQAGMTGSEWLDRYITFRRWTDEEQTEADRGLKPKQHRTGATRFENLGEIADGVRAVIYAGQYANPTTFLHEMSHVLRRIGNNGQEFRTLFESVRNDERFQNFVRNADNIRHKDLSTLFTTDEWTEADDEFFAELAEAYWRAGQTGDSRLAGFFQRIRQAFRNVYRALVGTGQLNEEVRDYYDRLFGLAPRTAETATAFSAFTDTAQNNAGTATEPASSDTAADTAQTQDEAQDAGASSDTAVSPSPTEGEEAAITGERADSHVLAEWRGTDLNRAFDSIADNETVRENLKAINPELHRQAGLVRESTGDMTPSDTYHLDPRYSALTEEESQRMRDNAERYDEAQSRYESKLRKMENTSKRVTYTIGGRTYGEMARISSLGTFTPSQYIAETGADESLTLSVEADNVRIDGFVKPDPNMLWDGIGRNTESGDLYQTIEDTAEWQETDRRLRANSTNFDIAGRPLAPNGQLSNLPYREWVTVRTPSFKAWFGDWESGSTVERFLARASSDISNNPTTAETARETYRAIGKVTNRETGMVVDFVNSAFGKIIRHKGYDPRLIGVLDDLFADAVFMNTEPADFDTPRADGTIHKQKNNIASFTHFINKFRMDGNDYLIRYTVQDLKSRKGKGGHQFHSQQITNIKLSSLTNVSTLSMWAEESTASDSKLTSFLKTVNNDVSKVVDENGEPLVVYHGTASEFSVFDRNYLGSSTEAKSARIGFFFTNNQRTAEGYGNYASGNEARQLYKRVLELEKQGRWEEANQLELRVEELALQKSNGIVMPAFLNIKNPYVVDADGASFKETGKIFSEFEPDKYDGMAVYSLNDNIDDDYVADHYIALKPNQIKSINNRGTFDDSDSNIYYQTVYHGSPYTFSEFSTEHMGEGAGRQDYGWGLYFSDVEEYARGYADRARTADSIQDDIERLRAGIQTANARLAEAQAVRDAMNADGYWENNEQYQEALRNGPSSARFAITRRRYENATNEEYAEAVKNSIVEGADRNIRMEESSIHDMQRRLSEAENTSPQTRNLYIVELPDNARWLDINETVPRSLISAVMRISAVRQGIMDNWGSLEDYRNAMLGSSAMGFYNDLAMIVGSDREASQILNRAGITGFRYPADGIAERAGTGPYNYVVFNPSDAVIRSHELYQTIDEDAIRQPLNENTYEAAIELASVAHPQFAGIIEEIRNLTGADDNDVSIRRAFKGKARSIEKAISDYSGDFSRILDYDGAMIRYSDLADAENAWNTVKERYADRIVKEKHLSTPLGYQDFKVNIRMDNGSIAEIQFLDKNTLSVKNGIGHKLYEISRRIDSLENQGVRNLQDIQEAITAWSRYEYANGYLDGVTSQGRDSARDSASSREIMQALVSALSQNHSLSALLNARSEMVLPSGEITTETGEALLDSILYGLSLISTNLNSSATTASNQSINEQRGGVNGSLFQTIDDDWIVEEIQDDITDDGSVSRDSMNANDAQAIEDTLQSLIRIAFEYTDYDEYREVAEWSYFAEDEIIDKAWNIAKNPNGDGTGNSAAPSKTLASPDTSASSEEAKDREFSEIISTDAGFDEWLEAIQIALRDADTEGQRAVYEAIEARHLIAPLIEALLHPSENQQYLKTRQSQARSRASAKGILKASPAFYRDLYAKATDSEFWTSLYADSIPEELMALPEEDAASLSISARKRLAEDIRDENLKNAILSGNEVFGEEGVSESLKRVLDKEEEAIRKGEADLAALRDEYKRLRDRYTTQSIEKNNLWKKVIELDEQIDRAEERLHTISERIAASSRADFGEDGNNPAQRNIDIQSRLSSQISQLISQHNSYLRQLRNEGIRNAVSETRNTERQRANARVENARERGRQAVSDQYQRDLERMRKIRADRDNKLRELREHYKGKEALRRVEAYKRRLMDSIMRPASSGVDVEYGRKVAAIQALIDPENRKYIRIDNKTWDINLLKKMFRGEVDRDPAVFDSLTDTQLDRLSKKSRDEFTVNELLSLKTAIDQLRDEGRTAWKLRKTAERKAIQQYRDKVMATILGLKNYREAPPSGSGEERDLNRSLWDRVKSIYRDTINMARKSQMLDGGKKGVFYHLLVAMKRDAQAQEFRMVVERMKPIRDYISEHKTDSSRFYSSYKVAFDGKEAEYRYTDLAYIYLSKNNIRNRNAVAYGVLVSETEKFNIANAVESEMPGAGRQAEDNRRKEVNKRITELGDRRYNELYSQAENIVKSSENSDLFEVVRLIEQDFNSDLFQRLVNAMRNTYNIAVEKEDYYLPINRTDFAGSEPGETIKQDLLNMIPGEGAVQRGFTKSRLDISPRQQKAINIDLFGVWQNSVEAQEHALANMDYVRLLKGVFVNHGSEAIRSAITSTFGKNMMRDIENHINMIANPRSFQKVDQGANQILRFFRGSLYSSYLGWRTSSLITQAVTSPMPFLGAVNPVELLQGAFTVFSHPIETWNEIQRLSPFMANRSQHPIVEWIKEESERADLPRARRIYAKFQNMGMQGLEYVDRYSVAIGWWAIYQKERNRILNSDAQMTEAELERAAAKVADEYVQETQPQSDITELSPLFQNRSEALQALTQFQSSLNVIWQNITYDIPQAFRNHQYARAWGMISGYIVAGVLLYLIQDGFDDDDDEKDKARKLAYAATTQITSGVPLISDYVDNALQQVITGESDGLFNSQSFPAIDKFFRAAANASKGNLENAYRQFFDSVMLFTGAPYSLLNDIEKMTGNFGQDEDASFHPEVLIGKDPE